MILTTDAGQKTKKFKGGIEQAARPASSTRSKNTYTPNDFIAEDRRERKLVTDRKKVYEDVLVFIRGADSLLILGPGEAKGEFAKHIKAKKLRGLAVEVETADKMTQHQLSATLREHFATNLVDKSRVPKKKAKATYKKTTKKTRT